MIIETIINILSLLTNILLTPIDNFIVSNIPSLANMFSYINGFLNYILSYFVWAISWIPIDTTALYFMFDILIFYFLWLRFGYVIGLFINWLKEFRT